MRTKGTEAWERDRNVTNLPDSFNIFGFVGQQSRLIALFLSVGFIFTDSGCRQTASGVDIIESGHSPISYSKALGNVKKVLMLRDYKY